MRLLAAVVLMALGVEPLPEAVWTNLPAWRGFDLLNKFMVTWSNGPFRELDFRLPVCGVARIRFRSFTK